ncbi:hypothetical protein HNP46_000304 [Pseudomonas nitritireducens]|uniref:Uncharacterized protein n=1 Tax=Pseudomonas nitroreducens TaxID=46680 RepID=A0A7W7KFU2_PSENT|nr:hypothetical protein [Pseudomonas nitritireducens]MBB4861493.1 hypothetical protein [Pseudomonas nitritireducens]
MKGLNIPRTIEALQVAFTALRKAGYFCKIFPQKYPEPGRKQVEDMGSTKHLYVNRGQLDPSREAPHFFMAWAGDGQLIAEELRAAGVDFEWDGTAFNKFRILPFKD